MSFNSKNKKINDKMNRALKSGKINKENNKLNLKYLENEPGDYIPENINENIKI